MSAGLFVFVGGGTGAVLRWTVGLAVDSPWGTFTANLAGSFLLALLMHPGWGLSDPWKLALGTGMMGGFTTYSTFNYEMLTALQRGEHAQALLLAALTLGACLAASAAGFAVGGAISQ